MASNRWTSWPSPALFLLSVGVLLCMVETALSLRCFVCGQYNEGVGSITPCINDTLMQLQECPQKDTSFCIKYTSEGSMVRDCVSRCKEKEVWGAKTFCCSEDGCNSSWRSAPLPAFAVAVSAVIVMLFAARRLTN